MLGQCAAPPYNLCSAVRGSLPNIRHRTGLPRQFVLRSVTERNLVSRVPFPKWLRLQEALNLVLGLGVSETDARSLLPRACRNGEVRARGRSLQYFDHGGQNPVSPDIWDQAGVDWEKSALQAPGRYSRANRTEISDVELSRDDMQIWLSVGGLRSGDLPAGTPVYRSPYLELMLAAEAHFGTRLDGSGSYAKKEEICGLAERPLVGSSSQLGCRKT